MRCAGYDRVDLAACEDHGIKVVRVPTYSPTSVAEHAVGLLFAVNRWAATVQLAKQQHTIRWPVQSEIALVPGSVTECNLQQTTQQQSMTHSKQAQPV